MATTPLRSVAAPAPAPVRAKRIRVPLLVDVVLVDDLAGITTMDGEPTVTRVVQHAGPLVNRLLSRRVARAFAIGEVPLPTFTDRTDRRRARRQEELEARLGAAAPSFADDGAELATLVAHVRGGGDPEPVGIAVQILFGRLFDRSFRGSPDTWAAARLVFGFPRALPPRSWWWRLSGELARCQRLLADAARRDPAAIHAITNTVHNVVETLSRMHRLAADRGADVDAVTAVRRCLVAPPALLRWCTQTTRVAGIAKPLRRGTLVVLRLGRAHDALQDAASPFLLQHWNQCPAHGYVTALLERVWTDART